MKDSGRKLRNQASEGETPLYRRILAGVLALMVLVLAVFISYKLITGMQNDPAVVGASPSPDNGELIDSSVEVPDASDTPNQNIVSAAFILIEVIMIIFIVYVLVRKKK